MTTDLQITQQPAAWGPELFGRYSELLFQLYSGAQAHGDAGFQALAFAQLKTLVPFDAGWWAVGIVDVGPEVKYSGPQIFDLHLDNMSEKMWSEYARFKKLDMVTKVSAEQPGVTLNVCSRDFIEEVWPFFDRFGIMHILATLFVDPATGLTTGTAVVRSNLDQPFSEQERLITQNLIRHMVAAFAQVKLAPWLDESISKLKFPSSAIVDLAGGLRHANNGFADLMMREWPCWRGPVLPDLLRKILMSGKPGQFSGVEIAASVTPHEELALVQLRSASLLDQLSERQLIVARFAVDGLGYKEIAQRMGLAPKTVDNYLSNVYRKLGVKNKLQLAEKLRAGG